MAGTIRSKVDSKGKRWSIKMRDHYGYFNDTIGADEDETDVYVNSEAIYSEIEKRKVFVVLQNDIDTQKFDEHKVILGATSKRHAKEIYLRNYSKGFKGFGSVEVVDNLNQWLGDELQR